MTMSRENAMKRRMLLAAACGVTCEDYACGVTRQGKRWCLRGAA